MSILEKKYSLIAPKIDYLSDEVVLAQAWKKTQKYIRKHNWYVDVLELDFSVVDLEHKIKEWATSIKTDDFKPDNLRLVLAPKNAEWSFSSKGGSGYWGTKEQKLRPLAHLNIRDQTIATAVMLCLADAVETVQGPSNESDFLKAQKQGVYSYGNRLQCEWISEQSDQIRARFSWGNSQCYRKYYDDYQKFLARPKKICQHYASKSNVSNNLFVVSLDLKSFYEHIDRNALINQLRNIHNGFVAKFNLSGAHHSEESFWTQVKRILNWTWEEGDWESLIEERPLGGLPQGLVASGFLSNAYLLEFDTLKPRKSVGQPHLNVAHLHQEVVPWRDGNLHHSLNNRSSKNVSRQVSLPLLPESMI